MAEAVPGLSNRLLSERLDELVAAGLVTARGVVRPVYSLTENGRDLRAVLSEEMWNRTWESPAG